MTLKRKPLSRRSFLRGAGGAMVALPPLAVYGACTFAAVSLVAVAFLRGQPAPDAVPASTT